MKFGSIAKTIFGAYLLVTVMACEKIEKAFENRVTTYIDVAVVNNGSEPLAAIAVATQKYDANRCSQNGQARSSSVQLNPNQSTRVSASIECNATVHAWVTVYKQTQYKVGYIFIHNYETAKKLTNGLQFRIADQNHQNATVIQVENAISEVGSYDHFWSLSPTGADQAGWIKAFSGSSGTHMLYFSLPQSINDQNFFIEFDDRSGIQDFGPFEVKHVDGVYRSRFTLSDGPAISAEMSSGTLTCDDVGCNVVR